MSSTMGLLGMLGSDILIILVDILYADSPNNMIAFRSTCRDVNIIVFPFLYRKINFNARKLEELAGMGDLFSGNLYRNLTHVVLKTGMVWEDLVEFLNRCDKLSEITWFYGYRYINRPMSLFPEALRTLYQLRPHLRLSIRNVCFPYAILQLPGSPPRFQISTTIPVTNITSIITMGGGHSTIVSPIQKLMVSCINLEVLHLHNQSKPFKAMDVKLPPVIELVLGDERWSYSSEEVSRIWDFSKLRHLDLRWSVLSLFLKSVPHDLLTSLRLLDINYEWMTRLYFHLGSGTAESYHDERMEALISLLLKTGSKRLRVRVLNCDRKEIGLNAYHPLLSASFPII